MIYLSIRADPWRQMPETYGYIATYCPRGDDYHAIPGGALWMLDNGAFSGRFRAKQWIANMKRWSEYSENCLGVIVPDAVDCIGGEVIGNWSKTLEMFYNFAPVVRSVGLPVAYALRDSHPPDAVPFDRFDTLFVAGSTEYKLSSSAEKIALEAKRRGKWVHVGRVNNKKRMRIVWYADSVDGTAHRWKLDEYTRLLADGIKSVNYGNHQLRMF